MRAMFAGVPAKAASSGCTNSNTATIALGYTRAFINIANEEQVQQNIRQRPPDDRSLSARAQGLSNPRSGPSITWCPASFACS
jgi:hypothetical protein